jgi:membrane-associated phospholipid phosphatase
MNAMGRLFASSPLSSVWRQLNGADRLTVAYNVTVGALLLVFHARLPGWWALLLPNLAMLVLLGLVFPRVGPASHPVWRLLRAVYPVLFIWAAYEQTGAMNHLVFPGFQDEWLLRLDQALFGCNPAADFQRAWPQAVIAELMHGAYFAYYLLYPGLAVLFYFRRSRAVLDEYLSSLCLAFYFCCLVFIIFPATGPLEGRPASAAGSLFPRIMDLIYRWFELPGGAFPSSHAAVAVIMALGAVRYAPRWAVLCVPACIAILLATVYCSYHYAVDVLAGVVVAMVAAAVVRWHFTRRAGLNGDAPGGQRTPP